MSATSLRHSSFSGDFPALFRCLVSQDLCERLFTDRGPRGGGSPKLSPWQWLMARVYHAMAPAGTFSTHVKQITNVNISDSALSQRGQSIGWQLLAEVLGEVLQPLADPATQPAAFHQGLRLLALDGTRFKLRNTEPINAAAFKVPCSKGSREPAFAHLLAVVLAELGVHQPLAATFGWQGEGESTLARELFNARSIPGGSLLLADRLFGSPWLLWSLLPVLKSGGSHALVRVKSNLKARRGKQLCDGSWLVSIDVQDPSSRKKAGVLEMREIHADIRLGKGKNARIVKMRLWTSLLDGKVHPALEIVELFASRWEQELFFRELKSHLHGCDGLLDAGTPDTAVQEVLAMLLAASLVAMQRLGVAQTAKVDPRRISFAQVHQHTVALCQVFELGHDLIGKAQRVEWTRRVLNQLAQTAIIPKRRSRSCPRALRQPVKDWPKVRKRTSTKLVKKVTISKLTNP